MSIITDNTTNTNLWEIRVYNSQGLIAMENGVGGRQTTYTYDQARRPLTMSNNLASFTYTYNGGGQLTKRVENFGTTGLTETFAYDAGGCLTSSNLPASITQGGYTRTYTYDVNDQRDYSVLTKSNSTLPFAAGKRYYFGDFERIDYIFR